MKRWNITDGYLRFFSLAVMWCHRWSSGYDTRQDSDRLGFDPHWDRDFLPPANKVCKDYVFIGVCLSTREGGGSRSLSKVVSILGWSLSVESLYWGISVQGSFLCPGGSLSRRVIVQVVSVQEGLCPAVSVRGSLCPGGSLSGESLSGESLSRGSLSRRAPIQ